MGEINVKQSVDLRGISCPVNYVKAKLALEELEIGQVLQVLLDDGEPIINVPRSAKDDGNEIIEVSKSEDYYKVLIKKG
jgi:tRNA 2-thiouridine synthesizing protein A